MPLVDITWPVITTADALRAASAAFVRVFGRLPDYDELALIVAWGAHETGRWKRAAGNNPGGVKASVRYPGDYYAVMTPEWVRQPDGTKKPVKVRQLFRSYPTLEVGMVDWLGVLKRGYPQAVAGLKAGDVKKFVLGLLEGWKKSLDYFSAPPELYLKAVAAHVPEVERELAKLDGEAPRSSPRLFEPSTYGSELFDRIMSAAEEDAALWRNGCLALATRGPWTMSTAEAWQACAGCRMARLFSYWSTKTAKPHLAE